MTQDKGSLRIEKDGEDYFLVHEQNFDYSNSGYKSTRVVKQQVLDCNVLLDELSKDISMLDEQIKSKEDLISKMDAEMGEVFNSHEFLSFKSVWEIKYKSLVNALSKFSRYEQEKEQLKIAEEQRKSIAEQINLVKEIQKDKEVKE